MESAWTQVQSVISVYGLRVIGAIALFIVGRWIAKGAKSLLQKSMRGHKVDETLVSFTASLAYFGLLTFVIIAALSTLGIQVASFIAVLGAAGLAIGLALQGSLANFAAGVLLIIFKPFKVGDYIEGGGIAGSVEEIGIFTTELKSPDNKLIIVPNAKMTSDNIINYSAKDTRRLDLVAGVSYSDNLDQVRTVLTGILNDCEYVLDEPAPTIGVLELADSSVNFAVRPWVKTADYWNAYFELQEEIKKRFDAEGISIPFPQTDVYVHQQN
jgi:small conductance mechanosensitive channel